MRTGRKERQREREREKKGGGGAERGFQTSRYIDREREL